MNRLFHNLREWRRGPQSSKRELNKSNYSLVSCEEVTPDTLQLWLELPEEVKNDPEMEKIRLAYEKKKGLEKILIQPQKSESAKRLHAVSSAPTLGSLEKNSAPVKAFDVIEEDVQKDRRSQEAASEKISFIRKYGARIQQAQHYTKLTVLLGCWIFFTAIFLSYNERHEIKRNSSIRPGVDKHYTLQFFNHASVMVQLAGPFLTEPEEIKLGLSLANSSQKMIVSLEKWKFNSGNLSNFVNADGELIETSEEWSIVLQNDTDFDFNEGIPRSSVLRLKSEIDATAIYALRMQTTSNKSMPFTISYTLDPLDPDTGVIYAVILLSGLYVLIIFELVKPTMAAIIVSTMSLAVLAMVGQRPTLSEVISWLDHETLVLLFSMMLLVTIMAETGIFDYCAVFAFEVTKGRLWPLINLLCMTTGILSMFLDNVTTVLLMSPVTIKLCEVMDLDPVPILMFMAIYSNVGGTGTPVGDPPNVIVASNKAVIDSGINFTNFTAHMAFGVVFVFAQTSLQIRYMFRDTAKLRLTEPREVQDIRHQISIWRRAVDSLPHLSRDVNAVRERLERKIAKLKVQLEVAVKQSNGRACPKDTYQNTLVEMKEKYKIRDKALLVKASIATAFVVVVFFLHAIPELNRISLGWTALLGVILLLILANREDIEPILHRVEWSTLLFFAALFVLMEALSKLGLIVYIGGLMEQVILKVDMSWRLAVAILLIIWVSGIISAFVDNIPLTTMMVRVVVSMGSNPALNLPMQPLIWALLYGACLGGNGTLIAASANVVCAGVAQQHGYKFTFSKFFRVGFPITIGHLVTTSVYLLVCHCVFGWH